MVRPRGVVLGRPAAGRAGAWRARPGRGPAVGLHRGLAAVDLPGRWPAPLAGPAAVRGGPVGQPARRLAAALPVRRRRAGGRSLDRTLRRPVAPNRCPGSDSAGWQPCWRSPRGARHQPERRGDLQLSGLHRRHRRAVGLRRRVAARHLGNLFGWLLLGFVLLGVLPTLRLRVARFGWPTSSSCSA